MQVNTQCEGSSLFTAPLQGYALGALSAFLSALAAVYTEWVMKRTGDSLYWQNIQLYSFGVVFNALGLTIGDVSAGVTASPAVAALAEWAFRLLTCVQWSVANTVMLLQKARMLTPALAAEQERTQKLQDSSLLRCLFLIPLCLCTVDSTSSAPRLSAETVISLLPAASPLRNVGCTRAVSHQAHARRVREWRVADQPGARVQLGDRARRGQPGVQRPARLLGDEVCRLHHEGAACTLSHACGTTLVSCG